MIVKLRDRVQWRADEARVDTCWDACEVARMDAVSDMSSHSVSPASAVGVADPSSSASSRAYDELRELPSMVHKRPCFVHSSHGSASGRDTHFFLNFRHALHASFAILLARFIDEEDRAVPLPSASVFTLL